MYRTRGPRKLSPTLCVPQLPGTYDMLIPSVEILLQSTRKAGILPDLNSAPLPPPSVPTSNLLCADSSEARRPTISDDSEDGPDPIVEVENEVSEALDDLEATGALQQSNRMTIEELLNPIEETHPHVPGNGSRYL